MAIQLLKSAMEKIEKNKIEAALKDLNNCNMQAVSGVHMSPTFAGVLRCCQLRMISAVMMELEQTVEGVHCFIPIHCMDKQTRETVKQHLSCGLQEILKRAEKGKRKKIRHKEQQQIDPYLAGILNYIH